ncbi:hypothetical protein ACFV1W_22675 [Kitasatospora sp. NPDC059648]|uniref:hypothetical protein n=1 Tax=Kitasatospora sp. NPDC059648 TaxID=3346894 RepID=UPI003686A2C8
MTNSERRPLWRPFSESPADPATVPPSPEARLTAVERARTPFLESEAAPAPRLAPGAHRPLGPGGLASPAADS